MKPSPRFNPSMCCTIRERMALPRRLFEKLPRLKLVTIIGTSLQTSIWMPPQTMACSSSIRTRADLARRHRQCDTGTHLGTGTRQRSPSGTPGTSHARRTVAEQSRDDPGRPHSSVCSGWAISANAWPNMPGVRDGGDRVEREPDRRGGQCGWCPSRRERRTLRSRRRAFDPCAAERTHAPGSSRHTSLA